MFNPTAMLTKAKERMSHSNPDPNTGREILYKEASNYKVVFISFINGSNSTSVANESQVYSTVHLDSKIRSSTTRNKPQSKFLNPHIDSWAVPFSATLSLFPKCQVALEERPGLCSIPEDKGTTPQASL